ncbi:terpenoid cyclases/Protein prenyltransferase [Rickenella mellea]|uniref:Terpenoid cyclases/Protein prenyltransferase n=1 Tax=Rickenella mellea TaxID=50990 RepID=A0A4Y7PYR5_9AGAM|nr:terpenoid cyclases/Protein prenyltransferase [Rickenella mellea]
MAEDPNFTLNKASHASHCLRCLRGLPGSFAEADTSRVAIGFYCLGALDILGLLSQKVNESVRQGYIDWIYNQQTASPLGTGFRPSPYSSVSTSASDSQQDDHLFDRPNLIMTYTALLSLAILRDDLTRVDRKGLVNLVRHSQQDDGSFSAFPGKGEADLRIVYTAFAICHMLDDWSSVNIDKAISFIRTCRTYEGGYGEVPFSEAQGGPTYCALASLHLLPAEYSSSATLSVKERRSTVRWLAQNQAKDGGFRGRTEKVADACYSFWCGASLRILGAANEVDEASNADFLNRCQFRTGGIAKTPNEVPDPYHTYLSLAALAMYPPKTENLTWSLPRLDPLLNATEETARWARDHLRISAIS